MAEIIIERRDNGKAFEVSEGDLIGIRLQENPSTGYSWDMGEIDSPVVELLQSDYAPAKNVRQVGGSGVRVYQFRAKSSGSERIHLKLRRPWDPEDKAAERFEINLSVTGN
jgi:inhibitor of cysteine peptidase